MIALPLHAPPQRLSRAWGGIAREAATVGDYICHTCVRKRRKGLGAAMGTTAPSHPLAISAQNQRFFGPTYEMGLYARRLVSFVIVAFIAPKTQTMQRCSSGRTAGFWAAVPQDFTTPYRPT
jgi:hypothetical protein